MLFVRTKLGKSNVHGIGCFAREFIKSGALIWKFTPGFDQEFAREFPDSLAPAAREQFLNYAYISRATGNYILCSDDTRFFNHSDSPNVKNIPMEGEREGCDIAVRDIEEGEEILYDYNAFADPLP